MNAEATCMYCLKNEQLHGQMLQIGRLNVSTLYLSREQTYRGRCIVAFDQHRKELFDLDENELIAFGKDVAKTAKAIYSAFHPDKLNYATYGDLVPHLHMHLVPKYKDGDSWGKPFGSGVNYQQFLSEDEYRSLISKIKNHLD